MAEKVDIVNQQPSLFVDFYSAVKQKGFVGVGAFVGGYYGLGALYDLEIMDSVTIVVRKIARSVLKYWRVGYAGMGAAMPWIDWYTAVGVRLFCAFIAGTICLIIQKIFICSLSLFHKHKPAFLRTSRTENIFRRGDISLVKV